MIDLKRHDEAFKLLDEVINFFKADKNKGTIYFNQKELGLSSIIFFKGCRDQS